MGKKDVLASGGKKATFATSTGVTKEHWDRIFGGENNLKKERKSNREQRTSKEDRKFFGQEEA